MKRVSPTTTVPFADAASLVERIHLVNGAWHALRDLWPAAESGDPTLGALRVLKSTLQAQLLRRHHPAAFLAVDPDPELPEPCFSVRLRAPLGGHPRRVPPALSRGPRLSD